jgi:hypothetical protein
VPQECIYITAIDFRSDLLSGSYQVPSYAAWLARADMRPAYAYHRRVLQLLQWRHPGERWVLKAPSHLQSLPALLDVYPDARIVWTHRDPLQVMASMTSLLATLYWVRSDRIDAGAIARRWSRGVAHMLEIAMRQRDGGLIDDSRIIDVRYRDLLDDPIAAIRRVYSHFDLTLGAGAEARMRAYLAAKPQGRHGVHAYTFADTGLDLATERERFAAYQRRFEIPSEF